MKTRACLVLASLLFASPAFADGPVQSPVQKDKPAAAEKVERGPYTTGLQLQAGTTASFLGGEAVKGAGFSALMINGELLAGGYVSDHFGMFAGVRAGYGSALGGCEDCTVANVRLPVRFQYSMRDRLHGLYFDGGLSFLNLTSMSSKTAATTLSNIADFELGLGYRIQRDRSSSFDIHLALATGAYTKSDSGDIPSDFRGQHFDVGLGMTYAFAP